MEFSAVKTFDKSLVEKEEAREPESGQISRGPSYLREDGATGGVQKKGKKKSKNKNKRGPRPPGGFPRGRCSKSLLERPDETESPRVGFFSRNRNKNKKKKK